MDERESRLIELVLRGNVEAFEPLVTPYRKTILTLAYRLSRDEEEAKEISQDTLLRAFRYLRTYETRKSFKNWLLQILVNVWRNSRKKRIETGALGESHPAPAAGDPAETRLRAEIRAQLLACLDILSPREREVFLLRDIEERSVKETAQILGSSPLSVRVHLSSARKKIRERIKEKFPSLLEGRR
jgi:RNA polymerase sigma-70 factor (ECF subfamily)